MRSYYFNNLYSVFCFSLVPSKSPGCPPVQQRELAEILLCWELRSCFGASCCGAVIAGPGLYCCPGALLLEIIRMKPGATCQLLASSFIFWYFWSCAGMHVWRFPRENGRKITIECNERYTSALLANVVEMVHSLAAKKLLSLPLKLLFLVPWNIWQLLPIARNSSIYLKVTVFYWLQGVTYQLDCIMGLSSTGLRIWH